MRATLPRIAALAAFILFVEMLLVRWVSTEVRVFAYIQNGVLIAAFLGLGLGASRATTTPRMLPSVVSLALIAGLIRDPFGWQLGEAISQGLAAFRDSVIWGHGLAEMKEHNIAPLRTAAVGFALVATLGLLFAIALVMYPLGQRLGAWLAESERPIAAYTADIAGSIAGIAAFDLLTLAWTPPWVWLAVGAIGLALLVYVSEPQRGRRALGMALCLLLPLPFVATAGETVWSPYQKLALERLEGEPAGCNLLIDINGTLYQRMYDLDRKHMAAQPELYPPEAVRRSHFVWPYEVVGPRKRVLVVGAGSGNDVEAALQAGVEHVQAVEIDPVILKWGREHHPNRPYDSPRVDVALEDARAYFHRAEERYDLIWFGLLDSHTTPSAYTNVRLDHFVYTRQAMEEARALLAPGGVIVLYFQTERNWMAKRLLGLMTEVFGAQPVSARIPMAHCLGLGGFMLIAGERDAIAPVWKRVLDNPENRRWILGATWKGDVPLTTDDWPYLYLEGPGVPTYHQLIAALSLVLMLLMLRRFGHRGSQDWVMMLLGAGFMLLEVSAVSRAALLYGATWTVNAYVIGAILGMILLANFTAARWPIRRLGLPFTGLAVTLGLLAVLPPSLVVGLPLAERVAAGSVMLGLPIYFSGLIFVTLWSEREHRDRAFGSNLLGSLLGGVASLLSMAIGFSSLALLGVAIYLAAFVLLLRTRTA